MKPKRKYRRLTHGEALEIVLAYHRDQATQLELAERYGSNQAYISRLVHGGARPEVYREAEGML